MMKTIETFYGPNAGYVLELYERYTQDPDSVDAATRAMFQAWSPERDVSVEAFTQNRATEAASHYPSVAHIIAATALAHAIRERGHLGAQLDPLGGEPLGDPALLPET